MPKWLDCFDSAIFVPKSRLLGPPDRRKNKRTNQPEEGLLLSPLLALLAGFVSLVLAGLLAGK